MSTISPVKKLCLCALCVALCPILPMALHPLGLGGIISLPMSAPNAPSRATYREVHASPPEPAHAAGRHNPVPYQHRSRSRSSQAKPLGHSSTERMPL